jgi:hypothetical protein
LLRQRLLGQSRALDALGPFEPTSDEYVVGQLARENRRRDKRIQDVGINLAHHASSRNMLWQMICERETENDRRNELHVLIIWALAILRGRIETGPLRIGGEQTLADIGRNMQRLKSSLSRASQAARQIKTSAAEHRAYRRDPLLQLMPSDAFFGEDQDKFIRLLEATAEHRFYPALYATDGQVSQDPRARFNDVLQAGVGDFGLIIEGLLGKGRNEKFAHLATVGLQETIIQRSRPRRLWRGEISDEQFRRWRERTADNRAREVPAIRRVMRALGLTLR